MPRNGHCILIVIFSARKTICKRNEEQSIETGRLLTAMCSWFVTRDVFVGVS